MFVFGGWRQVHASYCRGVDYQWKDEAFFSRTNYFRFLLDLAAEARSLLPPQDPWGFHNPKGLTERRTHNGHSHQ